jgi:transposase-like protein
MPRTKESFFGVRGSTAAGEVRCPQCNADAPTAPIRSRYREPRRIEHDWRCSACGNEWTASTQV